jgi:hypothetical protein
MKACYNLSDMDSVEIIEKPKQSKRSSAAFVSINGGTCEKCGAENIIITGDTGAAAGPFRGSSSWFPSGGILRPNHLTEKPMSDFSAQADVYRLEAKSPAKDRVIPQQKPVHSGTIAQCVKWVMDKRHDYPETYSMTVPLEAGFIGRTLGYREIEAMSKRPDFPQ